MTGQFTDFKFNQRRLLIPYRFLIMKTKKCLCSYHVNVLLLIRMSKHKQRKDEEENVFVDVPSFLEVACVIILLHQRIG